MSTTQSFSSTRVRSKTALLLIVCLAQFMVILDVSIVNVALPSIRRDLGFSATGLQWVVNAYTLTFAGFLLLGGRASDLLGRRRVFLAGTALFSVASLAWALGIWGAIGGLGATSGVLLGGVVTQGLRWPSIFLINVPIGPAVVFFGP